MLTPLSKILDVTVVEILQGEKIETENFSEVSDEIVVTTMENENKKLKRSVFIAVIIMLTLFLVSTTAYPVYHFFNSVPVDNEAAILKQFDMLYEEEENAEIVKSVKKGDYYFYLLQGEDCAYMGVFEKNRIFHDRITLWGGTSSSEPNKIAQYCCGMGHNTINVFFGYGMTDTEYSYTYRGVKSTKPIEEEAFLDVLIDINDSFTNADIIYD